MKNSKTFSEDDLKIFSSLSGDFNTLHQPINKSNSVVHGMLLVLQCLDGITKNLKILESISVNFHSFLYVGQAVYIKYVYLNKHSTNIYVNYEDKLICTIKLKSILIVKNIKISHLENDLPKKNKPKIYDFKSVDKKNILKLFYPKKTIKKLFRKNLTKYLTKFNIATLIAFSNIVGMKCPGQYSIFSSFESKFNSSLNISNYLSWDLIDYDKRWNRYQINAYNKNFDATLVAFERPKKIIQPTFTSISKTTKKLKLKNKKVLVIGGSNGIGEVCVKLLSSYNSDVIFTYFSNILNAKKIKKECTLNNVNFIKFDITNFDEHFFINFIKKNDFSDFYYFATPTIFNPTSINFNTILFNKFMDYYLHKPIKLINLINDNSAIRVNFFYPSSVATKHEVSDLKEYALAKKFGEDALRTLNYNNISIKSYKFPRILTNQTSSIHKSIKVYDIVTETNKAILEMLK